MNLIEGKHLKEMGFSAKTVKLISKINEYKGKQSIYKKQNKDKIKELQKTELSEWIYFSSLNCHEKIDIDKIINGDVKPQNKEELYILEYRDMINTINSAYEEIIINPKIILELHGRLHKFSTHRGGTYKVSANSEEDELTSKRTEDYINCICKEYEDLIIQDEIDNLIGIIAFTINFILINPFYEGNTKMAKMLTLLMLNKNGYEVGRFVNLGILFEDELCDYSNILNNTKKKVNEENYDINEWIEYFLEIILKAYIELDSKLGIVDLKKQTKTNRIEKIINSTWGYFTKEDIKEICEDIPEATINRVFNNLRKQKKIEVVARGRNAKWKKIY